VQVKRLTHHLQSVFLHKCLYSRAGAQETRQRWLAGQDNVFAACCDAWQIAHELEGVSQSLLSIDEEGLVRKWRTIPARLWKRWGRAVGAPPAPFILTPALLKIPFQEPRDGTIPVRLHIVLFVL
jgi:hypothetical protein